MNACLTPGHQVATLRFDDGRHYANDSHWVARRRRFTGATLGVSVGAHCVERQERHIGHTPHFWPRAVQTVAPKSINAWLKS